MTPNAVIAARLGALWGAAWRTIPAEIERALAAGGRALDVGCGLGLACLALAEAIPNARISGEDVDAEAIARARAIARVAGVDRRVRFSVGDSTALPRAAFELVTAQSLAARTLQPGRVLNAIRNALTPRGLCLLLEPVASEGRVPGGPVNLEEMATRAGFSYIRALPAEATTRLFELRR